MSRNTYKRCKLMATTFLVCLLFFFPLSNLLCASPALAASWPTNSSRLDPSLGFNQSYSRDGSNYVHCGIDIPGSAGSSVYAPAAGRIKFVGDVPSGDSLISGGGEGQTMRAVSIGLDDGRTITLMPFNRVDVECGADVSEGAVLGTLAASGDRSSAQVHLHMGLKQGSTYLDPMSLFGLTSTYAVVSAQESSSWADPAAEPGVTVESEAAIGALAQSAVSSEAQGDSAKQEAFREGAVSSGDAVWQPISQERDASAFERVWDACVSQVSSGVDVLGDLAAQIGISTALMYLIVLAAATGMVTACIALGVRVFGKCMQGHNHLLNLLLPKQGGDARMQKLFPASGDAFMSRSRLARRR